MLRHLGAFFTHRQSLSTGTGFFLLGFLFGNWATLIPYVKQRFGMDDAVLGLMLLCLPLGAMLFNPLAAIWVRKYGFQKVTIAGIFLLCLVYVFPVTVPTLSLLPFALLFAGVGMTILNISVNTTATAIEQSYGMSIMATCHGMFSVGLTVGSLMRSFTLLMSISENTHMLLMSGIACMLGLAAIPGILSVPSLSRTAISESVTTVRRQYIPKGALLTIILISVCTNVTEGAMTDWASLYMKEVVQTSPYFVGWGLFGYSFFMAAGRFFGDGIIPMLGRNRVLAFGGILSFSGLMLVIFVPITAFAIVGFAFVGLGVSCGAPILYASASRYPGLPDAGGLAMMNTYAMGGFLMGPAIIGFISELTSLKVAFAFVAILILVWVYTSRKAELY